MRYFFAIFILIAGCGPRVNMPFAETHPDIMPYVNYFFEVTGVRSYVPINFGDAKGKIATCYIQGVYKWIIVDKNFWQAVTDSQKIAIVFHELGHCELNMPHNNLMIDFDCPSSIMNQYLVSDFCFSKYEQQYLEEFKK